jgi:hydroxylamine reductase (hybrid-cluster protein)
LEVNQCSAYIGNCSDNKKENDQSQEPTLQTMTQRMMLPEAAIGEWKHKTTAVEKHKHRDDKEEGHISDLTLEASSAARLA